MFSEKIKNGRCIVLGALATLFALMFIFSGCSGNIDESNIESK